MEHHEICGTARDHFVVLPCFTFKAENGFALFGKAAFGEYRAHLAGAQEIHGQVNGGCRGLVIGKIRKQSHHIIQHGADHATFYAAAGIGKAV